MKKGKNGNGHRSIVDELDRLAETSDDAENWRELAIELKNSKGKPLLEIYERQLRATRAMRDAGVIHGAEAHYFVASPIVHIAENRWLDGTSPRLREISSQMDKIEQDHGLAEDESWSKGEAPDDWNELHDEYDRVLDEIIASTFDEYGEHELGEMYRNNYKQFDRLFDEGRHLVHGTSKE